jgi:hypothetical protein
MSPKGPYVHLSMWGGGEGDGLDTLGRHSRPWLSACGLAEGGGGEGGEGLFPVSTGTDQKWAFPPKRDIAYSVKYTKVGTTSTAIVFFYFSFEYLKRL